MSRIILGPMLPTVETDLGINHTRSGGMFFMISLGLSLAALGSSFLNSRIGHRNTIMVSFVVSGLAWMIASRTSTLLQFNLILMFVGVGSGLYIPSAIITIYTTISQRNWGKAISVHELAPNLGFLLTPVIVEIMLGFTSWRNVLFILGVVTFAAGAIYGLVGRAGRVKGEAPSLAALARMARLPSLWVLIVMFALSVAGSSAIYGMMSLYLVNFHHFGRETANIVLAVSRISGLFIIFAAGHASDRLGPRRAIRFVLAATGTLTILIGLASGWLLVAVIILQGIAVACFFPTGFAALARICAPRERNLALSLNTPVSTLIGAGIFPAFIGYTGDHYTFAVGIVATGVLILLGSFMTRWIRFHNE